MSFGGSQSPYIKLIQQFTPEQMGVLSQLSSILGGQLGQGIQGYQGQITPGASPLQEQAFGMAGDWMGRQTPEAARGFWEKGFVEPTMEQWQKETIPAIREQFIGQGLGDSSGLNRALAESGRQMTTGLGGQLEQILMQQEQGMPGALGQIMGGMATPQRQITSELMQEPYMKWQTEQPWANPWLQQLQGVLGTRPYETVAAPRQWQAGLCILATACYGKNSPEVDLFRYFRDHVLSREIIRGYYVFSDLVFPLMKFKPIKSFVKVAIVNPLYRAFRRMVLKQPRNFQIFVDTFVMLGWLLFWKILGSREAYTRKGGEVF